MSRDGRELGEITDLELDDAGWQVTRLAVRLRRSVLSDLDVHKPLIGTRIVWLPVDMVEGLQDAVVLRTELANIEMGEASSESEDTAGDDPVSAPTR